MKNLRGLTGSALSLMTFTVAPLSHGQVIYDNFGHERPSRQARGILDRLDLGIIGSALLVGRVAFRRRFAKSH